MYTEETRNSLEAQYACLKIIRSAVLPLPCYKCCNIIILLVLCLCVSVTTVQWRLELVSKRYQFKEKHQQFDIKLLIKFEMVPERVTYDHENQRA